MSEQRQIREQEQSHRRRRRNNPGIAQTTDETSREIQTKLNDIDAAFDEYMTATPSAGENVVIGQQQPHQVVTPPLSDEVLVRGFRQTRGE